MSGSADDQNSHASKAAVKAIGPSKTRKRSRGFESGGASRAWKEIARKSILQKKNTYTYEPIDYHEDIRVLRIFHDDKRDAPLSCMLFQSGLSPPPNRPPKSKTKIHPYRALSYWWGEVDAKAEKELRIYQDARPYDHPQKMTEFNRFEKFYVRENLYAALVNFREPKVDVDLWVDALCINQANETEALREKTAQVARMNEIYSQAQSVCIWLGEGNEDTGRTFQFLRQILNLEEFDNLIREQDPEKWYLLIKLMKNRWFSRRWVIQELALAKDAFVHWGEEQMMWTDFADAIALAMTKHLEIKDILKHGRKTLAKLDPTMQFDIPEPRALGAAILVNASSNLFRRSDNGQIQQRLIDLEVLVSSLFLPFEASEPRDTIYAVLSLAKDTVIYNDLAHQPSWVRQPTPNFMTYIKNSLSWIYELVVSQKHIQHLMGSETPIDPRIIPNYDKRLIDVWADFMEYCIEKSQSLDIICRHWAPRPRKKPPLEVLELEKQGRVEEEKIPTWVPAIDKHEYGGALGILDGRKNGDSLVGILERQHQQRYNASGGLLPSFVFGRFEEGLQFQKQPEVEDIEAARNTTTIPTVPLGKSSQSGTTKLFLSPSPRFDGTLHVKGFQIDTIGEEVSGRVLDGVLPVEGLQFGGWAKDPVTDLFPERVPERLWRTLVADRGLDGMAAPTWYRRACLECLHQANSNGDLNMNLLKDADDTPDAMKMFLERMRAVTWCRRLFLTKGRGSTEPKHGPLLGLGPQESKTGDMVCILFGCSVPVVLRKVANSGRCTFVGECYIHGRMDGESLPPNKKLIPEYPYCNVDGFTIV